MAKVRQIGEGLVILAAFMILIGAPGPVAAETISARLRGFEEVPAVSTTGTGHFQGTISDATSIDFVLDYTLEGTVQQAHIHVGQTSVNGGIVIFLCTNLTPPPGVPTPPPCPPSPGTVSGTRTAAAVVAVASQGISSGEFAAVLVAIRSGVAYANVHSAPNHPGGEIRGQLRSP